MDNLTGMSQPSSHTSGHLYDPRNGTYFMTNGEWNKDKEKAHKFNSGDAERYRDMNFSFAQVIYD